MRLETAVEGRVGNEVGQLVKRVWIQSDISVTNLNLFVFQK